MSSHVHSLSLLSALFTPTRGVAVLVAALMLAGCGGSERSKSDTQIAATVNQGEISVHQLQVVLQRQPQLAAVDGGNASARVLEGLIDQELAAQAARSASLDKDPRVVQRLEAAKREILAQAWQESVAEKVSGVSSDEVDRYYEQKPQLFAQRRLYTVQESAAEGAPEAIAALTAKLAETSSADEVAALLQRSGLRHQSRAMAQAAEDLPLSLLERLAPLEAGQSTVFAQGGTARIYTLLHAQKAPIDRRDADRAIAAYLANSRRGEAVAGAMKQMRAAAKIEYQGNFAKPAAKSASAP
ncbi:EpsD family peptidyl-prolyl cis-trans isomerase [Variovorax sp. YR752]|uniref:EpsD family peptidyl-prolyl cis-trans isomerase n=1 Tax=Variovorax sp. YR752 TaxID=1884383 RepID=UPI003137EE4A